MLWHMELLEYLVHIHEFMVLTEYLVHTNSLLLSNYPDSSLGVISLHAQCDCGEKENHLLLSNSTMMTSKRFSAQLFRPRHESQVPTVN